jgi:hypothetical protein
VQKLASPFSVDSMMLLKGNDNKSLVPAGSAIERCSFEDDCQISRDQSRSLRSEPFAIFLVTAL